MGSKTATYPASTSWVTIHHPDTDPAYRKDDLYRANCKQCGPVVTHNDYDIVHAMASDHQTEHQRSAHDDLFGQGAHERDFPHMYHGGSLRTAMGDGSTTNGRIVGNCPGCQKPIRRHQTTAHDDEFRHLHNTHVRCHGESKTAADGSALLEAADIGGKALNGAEHELEKPADEWAYRAESALELHRLAYSDMDDQDFNRDTNFCGDRHKDHECGLDYQHAGPHHCTLGGYCDEPNSSWWGKDNHMVKHQSLQTHADYLGRPDANNPTGRGPDEYRARTWDGYSKSKPMQSVEDRAVNTPVLPQEPLKTRNINTPTPGLRGEEGDMRHSDDEDDDED
jgi:hypothetical protein